MQSKEMLKKIVEDNYDKPDFYVRNLLKEYLQILILSYIYSKKPYNELFFYGGTCLSHCYNLPRLSEDLDFVDVKKEVKIEDISKDIASFLEKEANLPLKLKVHNFHIYFKFPILKELGLVKNKAESDYLFVKVEIFSDFNFCESFQEEFKTIFKYNHSVLVKTFDLPTLMATKIRAVLYRRWEKTGKDGKDLATVKGRDFFDLMWFLQMGVKPNLKCIEKVETKKELKEKLLGRVEEIDKKSIDYDLKNFIANTEFVYSLSENIKDILKKEIEKI